MVTLERQASAHPPKQRSQWGKLGGAARRILGRKSTPRRTRTEDGSLLEQGPQLERMATAAGFTEKERARAHEQAQLSPTSVRPMCRGPGQLCEHCEERRVKLAKLGREIENLRQVIINDSIVTIEPPEDVDVPAEVLELVQESAKLRITLDALCRFQSFSLNDS